MNPEGRWSSPNTQHWRGHIWSVGSSSGLLRTRNTWTHWSQMCERPQRRWRDPWGMAEPAGTVLPREGSGGLSHCVLIPKGGTKKEPGCGKGQDKGQRAQSETQEGAYGHYITSFTLPSTGTGHKGSLWGLSPCSYAKNHLDTVLGNQLYMVRQPCLSKKGGRQDDLHRSLSTSTVLRLSELNTSFYVNMGIFL